ncbi:hypothetical protein B484DRAFT_397740 [Ochromonadaceae sp. CCMP2298]|nr:hypothetical protein B484DRAFT_397740 [Ochromonadaceae sp. CCMP2298]
MQRIFPLERVFLELGAGGEDRVAIFRALVEGRHNWPQSDAHHEMSVAGGNAVVRLGVGVHAEEYKNSEACRQQHVRAGIAGGHTTVQQGAGIHSEKYKTKYKNSEGYTLQHVDAGNAGGNAAVQQGAGIHSEKYKTKYKNSEGYAQQHCKNSEGYAQQHVDAGNAGGNAAVQQGAGVHSEKCKNSEGYAQQHVDAGNANAKRINGEDASLQLISTHAAPEKLSEVEMQLCKADERLAVQVAILLKKSINVEPFISGRMDRVQPLPGQRKKLDKMRRIFIDMDIDNMIGGEIFMTLWRVLEHKTGPANKLLLVTSGAQLHDFVLDTGDYLWLSPQLRRRDQNHRAQAEG